MPCLAVVGGVRIEFYVDEHPPPHFHARMAEFVAAIGIDPVVILAGSLPRAKAGTVLE